MTTSSAATISGPNAMSMTRASPISETSAATARPTMPVSSSPRPCSWISRASRARRSPPGAAEHGSRFPARQEVPVGAERLAPRFASCPSAAYGPIEKGPTDLAGAVPPGVDATPFRRTVVDVPRDGFAVHLRYCAVSSWSLVEEGPMMQGLSGSVASWSSGSFACPRPVRRRRRALRT